MSCRQTPAIWTLGPNSSRPGAHLSVGDPSITAPQGPFRTLCGNGAVGVVLQGQPGCIRQQHRGDDAAEVWQHFIECARLPIIKGSLCRSLWHLRTSQ